MANPILVEVTRGNGVESRHRGAIAVIDGAGLVVASMGDIETAIFPRSAIKPLQALALVESGAADHFNLDDAELALACASHSGEPAQVDKVNGWLARLGLGIDDLECGAHGPRHDADTAAMVRTGQTPDRSYNNCSGKHAGFLSTALHMNEPTRGYAKADHPVQQRLKAILEDLGACDLSSTPHGIDGCGIPVIAMPLVAMARALSRMANPAGLPVLRATASGRILSAMTRCPEMVGGTGRFDTRMMAAGRGAVVVKTGAEGVYAGILPRLGLGIALKIDDGATRAAETAMAAMLKHFGALDGGVMAPVADLLEPVIANAAGEPVGSVRWVGDLA